MSKELTEHGKSFMRKVGEHYGNNDNSLLQGNNGILPFSNETDANKVWVANVKDIFNDNRPVKTNSQFIEYLINLYIEYADEFNVDANIVAAQGFEESEYKTWYYHTDDIRVLTSASIAQLPMDMMYYAIYDEELTWLDDNQKNKIINGMEKPDLPSSWRNVENIDPSGKIEDRQRSNHSVFHQNMIDNPDIVVFIQCRFISYISLNNGNYASSSLFAYNSNWKNKSTNYIQLLNEFDKKEDVDDTIKQCEYVERIFGYLGDPKQENIKKLRPYVRGFSFNYTFIDYDFNEFGVDTLTNYTPSRSTKDKEALIDEMAKGYDHAYAKFKKENGLTYNIKLNSVYRTPEHQYRLYKTGRNARNEVTPPPKTITPVTGRGEDKSRHNYYKTDAFDFIILSSSNRFLDGRKNPNQYKHLYKEFYEYFKEVVPTAVWGGNFKNQVNDVFHIQLN